MVIQKAIKTLPSELPRLANKERVLRSFPQREQVCLFPVQPILYLGYTETSLRIAVADLQRLLREKGYLTSCSGDFDRSTEQAVKRFQTDHQLVADGIVGPFTWAALYRQRLIYSEEAIPELQEQVEELQQLLRREGLQLTVNGHFDCKTEAALKRFQNLYGLRADGICGPMTWAVLLGQRQDPARRYWAGFYLRLDHNGFLVEQFLMLSSVYLGICLSPIEASLSFHEVIGMAYILTYLVPPLLARMELTQSMEQKFHLLRFAPYVLTGYFWKPIFKILEMLMSKM